MTISIDRMYATCPCGAVEHFKRPLSNDEEKTVLDGATGNWLCYECWHAAREKMTPYVIRRTFDRYDASRNTLLKRELEQQMKEFPHWYDGFEHEIIPHPFWFGDRLTHPAYGARRRAAVIATLSGSK